MTKRRNYKHPFKYNGTSTTNNKYPPCISDYKVTRIYNVCKIDNTKCHEPTISLVTGDYVGSAFPKHSIMYLTINHYGRGNCYSHIKRDSMSYNQLTDCLSELLYDMGIEVKYKFEHIMPMVVSLCKFIAPRRINYDLQCFDGATMRSTRAYVNVDFDYSLLE